LIERSRSRRTGRRLVDIAEAVSTSHLLASQTAPLSGNSHPLGARAESVSEDQPEH
jgi:hypothetical protein